MVDYRFKWAVAADYDALGALMFDAVHHQNELYSQDQRQAWMPGPRKGRAWRERLAEQWVILAKADDQYAGFMSLTPRGYIDFAYIRAEFRATGLFRRLYRQIEIKALEQGIGRLETHASLMARPAFAAMGFARLTEDCVDRGGASLRRFRMEKSL